MALPKFSPPTPAVPRADGEAAVRLDQGPGPTISIEQKTASSNPAPRSAPSRDHDYLRVLWARVGRLTATLRPARLAAIGAADRPRGPAAPEGTKFLVSPARQERKGSTATSSSRSGSPGHRVRADGIRSLPRDEIRLDKKKKHSIERGRGPPGREARLSQRLTDSVETALKLGQGTVIVAPRAGGPGPLRAPRCHHCGISSGADAAAVLLQLAQGMLPRVLRSRHAHEMDPRSWSRTPSSRERGAVKPLGAVGEATTWAATSCERRARARIDLNKPWKDSRRSSAG